MLVLNCLLSTQTLHFKVIGSKKIPVHALCCMQCEPYLHLHNQQCVNQPLRDTGRITGDFPADCMYPHKVDLNYTEKNLYVSITQFTIFHKW